MDKDALLRDLDRLEQAATILGNFDAAKCFGQFTHRDSIIQHATQKAVIEIRARITAALSEQSDGWVKCSERLPTEYEGELLMVYGQESWEKTPSVKFDTWQMQSECPVPFSSASIETGKDWSENDRNTHWRPMPPLPKE